MIRSFNPTLIVFVLLFVGCSSNERAPCNCRERDRWAEAFGSELIDVEYHYIPPSD